MKMLVRDLFEEEKITLDLLEGQSEESSYWNKAYLFIKDNWDTNPDVLTNNQKNWMDRILEDMVEKRIEGKL